MTLPALFIAHGSPGLALEESEYTQFLKSLGQKMLPRPKAIIVFSAHWESPVQCVDEVELQWTMHDFYGFPKDIYEIEYGAPGAPELSKKIQQLFEANNLPYQVIRDRGLDHGAWVILRLLYPDADIPIVALSIDTNRSPKEQYEIGKMLSTLRQDNVLIVGSGGLVHNLRLLRDESAATWATEFDDWVGDKLQSWNLDMLFEYDKRAPHARDAVPTYGKEHFVPLLYAMGGADDERTATRLYQQYQYGSLSLNCWAFGTHELSFE